VHLPIAHQAFIRAENFFDDNVCTAVRRRRRSLASQARQAIAQAPTIGARIGETIDVIDAHAID